MKEIDWTEDWIEGEEDNLDYVGKSFIACSTLFEITKIEDDDVVLIDDSNNDFVYRISVSHLENNLESGHYKFT